MKMRLEEDESDDGFGNEMVMRRTGKEGMRMRRKMNMEIEC